MTIPDSVTNIGDSVFYECDSMTSVKIGNSVKRIGYSAFKRCASLTSVDIPDSVTSIGDYAFSECENMVSVKLSSSVKEIGKAVFKKGVGLSAVTIPESVTSIGSYAFSGCSGLKKVKDGKMVKTIGESAFANCSLEEAILSAEVETIGTDAFVNNTDLTIYGFKDSYAESFANDNNIPFEEIVVCSKCKSWLTKSDIIIDEPKLPTCTETGMTEGSHCSVCGEVIKPQEVIPKLGYKEQKDSETEIEVIAQNDVVLAVKELDPADAPEGFITAVGEKPKKIYDISLMKNDAAVQPSGMVTVKIPCSYPNGKVFRVENDGTFTDMNASYENGFLVFETDRFSVLYIVTVPNIVIGDVNCDGKITIFDVTEIQKYLAEFEQLTSEQLAVADTNGDGVVNISDATHLQKYLAEFDDIVLGKQSI